jgi:hypothetical protein
MRPTATFLIFGIVPCPAWVWVGGIFAYDAYRSLRSRVRTLLSCTATLPMGLLITQWLFIERNDGHGGSCWRTVDGDSILFAQVPTILVVLIECVQSPLYLFLKLLETHIACYEYHKAIMRRRTTNQLKNDSEEITKA